MNSANKKSHVAEITEFKVGDYLPDFVLPPITRQTLAVYCGASGDHNAIHVDIDFAKRSGLDDVIAHGMLVMGYCSRALLKWVPQSAIREFDTRFKAMTHVGDIISVRIEVTNVTTAGKSLTLSLALTASDQRSEVKTTGTALVVLDK